MKKRLGGDLVVILFFVGLAFAIHSFGGHLADQTRSLRTEGRPVDLVVIRTLPGSPPKVEIKYMIDDEFGHSEVFAPNPPPVVGTRMTGVYHRDRPDRVRIRGLDEASIEEDRRPFRMLPLFLLAPLLLLLTARGAQMSGRDPARAAGFGVGVLLLAIVVGVNFDPDVQTSIAERLGTQALGMPSHLAVALAEVIVLGPALLIFGQSAVELMTHAMASGGSVRGISFVLWVISAPQARSMRRARTLFLVSGTVLIASLVASIIWLSVT